MKAGKFKKLDGEKNEILKDRPCPQRFHGQAPPSRPMNVPGRWKNLSNRMSHPPKKEHGKGRKRLVGIFGQKDPWVHCLYKQQFWKKCALRICIKRM